MESTKQNNKYHVFEMTSKDFGMDTSAHIDVISQRIRDHRLTTIYRNAILYNKHLFQNRIVLNIRCGVGLLSLFAAQAGAKCVYAVDASNAADYAHLVVENNNLSETIKVIKADIRKIELPVEKVDVIVSDWIGYALFYESHLNEMIYARNKWLTENGIIFPDVGKLYIAAISDTYHKNENIEWWRNVYGFNMEVLRTCALNEPRIQRVLPKQIMSKKYLLYNIDLNKATFDELKFRKQFLLRMEHDGSVDGLVMYFKVYFSKSHTPMSINTSPNVQSTRWLQTVFYFDQHINVEKKSTYCGGMELLPLTENSSHNIQVRMELFSGTCAKDLNLELEMCWHFKSRARISECETKEDAAAAADSPNAQSLAVINSLIDNIDIE